MEQQQTGEGSQSLRSFTRDETLAIERLEWMQITLGLHDGYIRFVAERLISAIQATRVKESEGSLPSLNMIEKDLGDSSSIVLPFPHGQ